MACSRNPIWIIIKRAMSHGQTQGIPTFYGNAGRNLRRNVSRSKPSERDDNVANEYGPSKQEQETQQNEGEAQGMKGGTSGTCIPGAGRDVLEWRLP